MIVVVGLEFEARIAVGPGMHVICSGDGRNLATALAQAITADCRGLVSFGVAGGLAVVWHRSHRASSLFDQFWSPVLRDSKPVSLCAAGIL